MFRARTIIVGGVTVIAVSLGLGAVAMAGTGAPSGPAAPGSQPNSKYHAAADIFPTNSHGQTYGSLKDAPGPNLEPDLIQARSESGVVGYVLRSELEPAPAASPRDAYAQMQAAMAAGPKTIPMYAQDGVTVVGSFVLDPPEPPVTGGR